MTRPIEPTDLLNKLNDRQRSKVITWTLIPLITLIIGFTYYLKDYRLKSVTFGSTLVLIVIGQTQNKLYRRLSEELSDVSEVARVKGKERVATVMSPSAPAIINIGEVKDWEPKLFDWALFNIKPERFPQIGLVADSGGGKSTTGLWLTTWLSGKHYAILPHKKPDDYPGIPSFCGGRNYGKVEDQEYDLREILENKYPNISVVSFVKSLHKEMDRRYKLYEQGIEDYPAINIHWDEYNAFIRKVNDKGIVSLIEDLIAEARKVKIRIIVMVQSALVEDMGLNGSLKKSIKFIQLADFAIDRADKEDKSGKLKQWMEGLIEAGDNFPVMIDSKPGIVPHKKYWVNSAETRNQLPGNGNGELGVESEELELNELEAMILQFGQSKPNTVIKARDLINNSRLFRGMTPEEVRIILQSLADKGIGQTEGEGNKLGWKYLHLVDIASTSQ